MVRGMNFCERMKKIWKQHKPLVDSKALTRELEEIIDGAVRDRQYKFTINAHDIIALHPLNHQDRVEVLVADLQAMGFTVVRSHNLVFVSGWAE